MNTGPDRSEKKSSPSCRWNGPFFSPYQGRPSKKLYRMAVALLYQQIFDFADEETISRMAFDIQWHYALDNPEESDLVKYFSPKTL